MTESLDRILSGPSDAVPEQTTEQVTPTTEGESQQTEQSGEGEAPGQKMVPHEALHAEKQKVKRYTEEVADFRKQLSETNAAWERRMAELVQAVKPKQETPQPPDIFENAPEAIRHTVAPQFQQISQTVMANAQLIAGIKYGDDKVAEAEKAFVEAVQSQRVDPADYDKVVGSPNRYAAAVQWHQRQLAQAEIGDDPAAFRAKVEAEILAKHGLTADATAKPAAVQPAPVMPSNLATARSVAPRSGPAWSGPTPIGDIFKR